MCAQRTHRARKLHWFRKQPEIGAFSRRSVPSTYVKTLADMHVAPAVRRWAARLGLAVVVAIAIGYLPGGMLRRDPRAIKVEQQIQSIAQGATETASVPLPSLPRRIDELARTAPLAVICGSGYRSSIAASLLQNHGFNRVQNVMGGMGAYLETRTPEWQPSDLVFIGENI